MFRRKMVVVLVIFSLFANQMFAIGLDSVFNGTSVKTDFGTWSSPRTGTKYFYGGSYTFAFKGAGRYQPFFQGEAPSIKFGCGGVSLSGGFIALLGIDEIKVLLKNAGATLAWGMMIALQYTMPGIAKVFASLRKWSREIQKLLQNACNMGKMLGSNLFGGTVGKAKTAIDNSSINKGLENWADTMNKGLEGLQTNVDDWMGDTPDASSDPCAAYSDPKVKLGCKNKQGSTIAGYALELAKTNSMSLTSTVVGAYAKNAGDPTNDISISKLSTFLSDGKIGSKTILAAGDQLDDIKTTVLVSRLFFGDVATPFDSLKPLLSATATNISVGTFELNPKATKDELLSRINKQVVDKVNGMTIIPPVISSPEQAAKALIDGITTDTDSKNCFSGYCNVADSYVYLIDMALDSDGGEKVVLLGNVYQTAGNIEVQWSGAYMEGLKVIRGIIKDKTNYNPTYTAKDESSPTVESPTTPGLKIPLLLPNIGAYIKDIVTLERKAKRETAYTASLKSLLARYNAYFYASSLIDGITAKVIDAVGKKGDGAGTPSIEQFMPYLESIRKTKEAILEEIKKDQANQITYQELAEMFKKIDDQIRTDAMKGY
ncbi:conjugal transfer protein TraH [Sulfurimonas sp.]